MRDSLDCALTLVARLVGENAPVVFGELEDAIRLEKEVDRAETVLAFRPARALVILEDLAFMSSRSIVVRRGNSIPRSWHHVIRSLHFAGEYVSTEKFPDTFSPLRKDLV